MDHYTSLLKAKNNEEQVGKIFLADPVEDFFSTNSKGKQVSL